MTSALWIGVEGTLGYVEALGSMAITSGKWPTLKAKCSPGRRNFTFWGLKKFTGIPGRIMIAMIGTGLSVLLWKGRWQPNTRDFELRFSAQVLLALLASPHCHIYDLSLVFASSGIRAPPLAGPGGWEFQHRDLACCAFTCFTCGLGADIVGVGISSPFR